MAPLTASRPPGIRLLEHISGRSFHNTGLKTCRNTVLLLTFFAYALYHATRKPPSIVKSVLHPKSDLDGGWAPFNGSDGTSRLGEIDVAFLSMYSAGMYFAGHLGDRIDLRVLLTAGMVGTGIFTSLFGVGNWLNIHIFSYYMVVQMLAGLFQSTGWPSVVAVVGNWCGESRRGLIMGIWNSHTSVGNIFGSVIAASLLKYGWGWSFAVPGILMAFMGLIIFMFLPVSPEAVGISRENEPPNSDNKDEARSLLLGNGTEGTANAAAIGFFQAWSIPDVLPYALSLFFAKLVAYTFLYWLPFYISHTLIDGKYLEDSVAGNLSTLFDIGGVFGGILAGHISDGLNARAMTAAGFMYCSIPALLLYRVYGSVSLFWNIALMLVTGVIVNGPYALITTAVSADLGTHSSLRGSSRALATVTAIIDGTGSVGAAIGPLLTGYISVKSWDAVFVMLMVAALIAGLLLTRLAWAEFSNARAARLQAAAEISSSPEAVQEVQHISLSASPPSQ